MLYSTRSNGEMNAFHSTKKHMFRSPNIRSDRRVLRLHFPRPDIAKRPKSFCRNFPAAEFTRDANHATHRESLFRHNKSERLSYQALHIEKPSGTDPEYLIAGSF